MASRCRRSGGFEGDRKRGSGPAKGLEIAPLIVSARTNAALDIILSIGRPCLGSHYACRRFVPADRGLDGPSVVGMPPAPFFCSCRGVYLRVDC